MAINQNLVGSIIGGAASAYATYSNNENVDKSLAAQSAENEKTRQYNLQLAQQQNQWNIEQWQRENDYNDPQAQIARLRSAGLNPDMVYGQSGISNTAASSPDMTSGAPATPVDYSSLANKRTIGDAIMQSLAIRQAEANIKKTEAEAKISDSDAKVRDELNQLGLQLSQQQIEKYGAEIEKLSTDARLFSNQADVEAWKHSMQKKFGEEYVKAKVKEAAAQANTSVQEMQLAVETLASRIVGINAENTPLVPIKNDNLKLVVEILRMVMPK